jgi:hypothetical protein
VVNVFGGYDLFEHVEVARLDCFGKLSQGRQINFLAHTLNLLTMFSTALPASSHVVFAAQALEKLIVVTRR